MNSKKGFLFTISAIFFASTLVFFAQGFYESNLAMEKRIISSSIPLNIVYLNEDITTDIANLLDLGIDINSNEKSILLEGGMASSSSVAGSLLEYNSFISEVFFNRSLFDKSLDLSSLSDGKAEFMLGDKLNLDYNYGNSLALYQPSSCHLASIDINIQTAESLSSYEWVKSSGADNFSVSVNYSDDSNSIIFADSISTDSLSSLKLMYSDGNALVDFGKITYLGSDYNNSFILVSMPNQAITYSIKAGYSDCNLYPVKINSVLSVKSDNFDSNTLLSLFK